MLSMILWLVPSPGSEAQVVDGVRDEIASLLGSAAPGGWGVIPAPVSCDVPESERHMGGLRLESGNRYDFIGVCPDDDLPKPRIGSAPVAVNDTVSVPIGMGVAFNPLANDYDADGDSVLYLAYYGSLPAGQPRPSDSPEGYFIIRGGTGGSFELPYMIFSGTENRMQKLGYGIGKIVVIVVGPA